MDKIDIENFVSIITEKVIKQLEKQCNGIPVGISNRHVHLSKLDREVLFGKDRQLTKLRDLKQPGQYACNEVISVSGPKGTIQSVRILGPERNQTQVELSKSDCIKVGANVEVRESGNLKNSAPITLIGPKGSVDLREGTIMAQRHIHMAPEDARKFGAHDKQVVSVKVNSERGGSLDNVLVRSGENHRLEMHLDTDEANAMLLKNGDKVEIIL